MHEWGVYDGLNTRLAAPISDFALPAHYPRKKIRAMGRVSEMSTVASELARERQCRWSTWGWMRWVLALISIEC